MKKVFSLILCLVMLLSLAFPALATDDVIVTDTFDPILNPITVTLDGVTLEEGEDYTYDETTGAFATVAGVVSVPAATYIQDPTTGIWSVTPGETRLVVVGIV